MWPVRHPARFEPRGPVDSLLFKQMHIVRGCDKKRNALVYMIYSDRLVDGSPENSTSAVVIEPWGAQAEVAKCAEFTKD